MKLTKMRKDGRKLTFDDFQILINDLKNSIENKGFITNINQVNSQTIKLGLRMRSFNICIARHGYNTQHCGGTKRRTNLPSWDQRVEYNNILNEVLEFHNISCNITSGPYTIRQGYEIFTEKDWAFQKPELQHQNEIRGYYIQKGDYKKVGA